MKSPIHFLLTVLVLPFTLSNCEGQSATAKKSTNTTKAMTGNFTEGKDFVIYERVRILDKAGFTAPQEAYSMLLPKGWTHTDAVIWNGPGTNCAGTFKKMKAVSADGNYSFEQLPDLVFGWNTNAELRQFNQNYGGGSYCSTREPMDANQFLRNVLLPQIGNPQLVKSESNEAVVNEMRQQNNTSMQELRQYGAGQMQFYQSALNAQVRWSDGREAWIVLGSNVFETLVPNIYNGTSDKIYTTQITRQTIFTYPGKNADQAKDQLSVIMSSIHTNPAWSDAVAKFWRDVRQQKNIVHVGKIKAMDEQTRQIGAQAIKNGNDRLRTMDTQMRTWEQTQNSQDRMHTEFIKTIREVENYKDASGKYEMTSGYDHAWSRGDGTSFIMTNNPNFDPSSVLQDQSWKEMKKVD